MTDRGISGAGGAQIDDAWWADLAGRVLHPVEAQIIEALRCIEQPLTPGDLFQIAEEKLGGTVFVHHMRRLSKLGAVELAERPSPCNPLETPYRLVLRRESDGR